MISVFVRALARPFYHAHAGFFFLLFFVGAGLMRSSDHIVIAGEIAEGGLLFLIMIFLFSLYQWKVHSFNRKLLGTNEYIFARHLVLMPSGTRLVSLVTVFIVQHAVGILYSLFVMYFMLQQSHYTNASFLVLYLLMSAFFFSVLISNQLVRPIREVKAGAFTKYLRKFKLPFAFWYPYHLIRDRPVLLFFSKIIIVAILVFCFHSFDPLLYDHRFLGISVVVATGVNVILAFSFYEFYILEMSLLKNLPISAGKRFLSYSIIAALLLLPETIIIIGKSPHGVFSSYSLEMAGFAIVNFLFFLHFAIYCKPDMENMGKATLFIISIQFYLVLSEMPLYGLILLMLPLVVLTQIRFYEI